MVLGVLVPADLLIEQMHRPQYYGSVQVLRATFRQICRHAKTTIFTVQDSVVVWVLLFYTGGQA